MEKNRNVIIFVLIAIIVEIAVLKFGVIESIKQKYYNILLKQVEQISISDESLQGNTESNINNYGLAAETNDFIFYKKSIARLYRADKDFNNETGLIENAGGKGIGRINVADDWVFFIQGEEVKRMKVDGSDTEIIFRGGYALDLHVIGNWIYFINLGRDIQICRMDVNGRNLQNLSKKVIDDIPDMAIYNNKLYYSYEHEETPCLRMMNLDGSEKQVLANIKTRDMVVEDEYIYYIDAGEWSLNRFRIKDKDIEKLSEKKIGKFNKDGKWLFYTIRLPKEPGWQYKGLYRIDDDGSNALVLDGDAYLDQGYIAVTKDWVLYDSINSIKPPVLKRIMKDGTNATVMEVIREADE